MIWKTVSPITEEIIKAHANIFCFLRSIKDTKTHNATKGAYSIQDNCERERSIRDIVKSSLTAMKKIILNKAAIATANIPFSASFIISFMIQPITVHTPFYFISHMAKLIPYGIIYKITEFNHYLLVEQLLLCIPSQAQYLLGHSYMLYHLPDNRLKR